VKIKYLPAVGTFQKVDSPILFHEAQ